MLILAGANEKLQIVTDASGDIEVARSVLQNDTGTITVASLSDPLASITSATTTDVIAAPGAGKQYNVKHLNVRNNHASQAVNVIVRKTDGTNTTDLWRGSLAASEAVVFDQTGRWTYYDSTGNAKVVVGNASSPLTFGQASLLANPAGGQMEYDGVIPYYTPVSLERGVINTEQFIRLTSTFTLTSQTPAQKLFNSPTNGQVTVGSNRTYQFECAFDLSSMSASSGSFGFAFAGTATLTRQKWLAEAIKATLATAAAWTSSVNTAANVAIATASTATVAAAYIRGILTVGTGGTIIPQVSLGVAAAAVVSTDSFFRLWPVGSNSVQSVGNWS